MLCDVTADHQRFWPRLTSGRGPDGHGMEVAQPLEAGLARQLRPHHRSRERVSKM